MDLGLGWFGAGRDGCVDEGADDGGVGRMDRQTAHVMLRQPKILCCEVGVQCSPVRTLVPLGHSNGAFSCSNFGNV